MGIPRFFRWLSDKYDTVVHYKIDKPVNNFYIDFNALIHNCCHGFPGAPKTEKEMISLIQKYFSHVVFRIVKPTNLVYIAVDGIAPMAKINQQRFRRFKSAEERKLITAWKEELGQESTSSWDSNAITPGTAFMASLDACLTRYFRKVKERHPDLHIIYSSYNMPGEGEHKIMEHIRKLPKDNNQTNVIYGLDADLIILSLLLERPDIYLFREKVFFGRKLDLHPMDQQFNYMYLDELIQCYQDEFPLLDTQNVIRDFCFLSFLFGNDFVPNVPTLSIREGGLDTLIANYSHVVQDMNKYITDSLGKIDMSVLLEVLDMMAGLEDHYEIRPARPPKKTDDKLQNRLNEYGFIQGLQPDMVCIGTPNWKDRYYNQFFKGISNTHVCYEYSRAIVWIWKYYIEGVQSQDWYYVYHKAPVLSDLVEYLKYVDLNQISVKNNSKTLTPLQQLLCVLPEASSELLPPCYRELIDHPDVKKYFPTRYHTDFWGKTYRYECHPHLPCIDLDVIKKVTSEVKLNTREARINKVYKEPRLF